MSRDRGDPVALDAAWQRHALLRLRPAAWRRLVAEATEPVARACLQHWAAADLPLVVTRRPDGLAADRIALGLPAPERWERRRLALTVDVADVASGVRFPDARDAAALLTGTPRSAWHQCCDALAPLAAGPRAAQVYGSHGWTLLTGLDHLRPGSDLDLLVDVQDAGQADAVVATLAAADGALPRLDGELRFPDGRAVAWREWQAWRAGRARQLLAKRIDGVALWAPAPAPTRDAMSLAVVAP